MITDKRIGVLAGGSSAEREVSLKTGNAVFRALCARGYNAVFVDAAGDLCSSLKAEGVQIAFIALHGGHGENGSVQGLLETMGIPYTGSGVLASALAMDKIASKKMFLYHNLPVAPFTVIEKGATKKDAPLAMFDFPWVIKPSNEGSSVGVSIVKGAHEVSAAVYKAFSYGDRLLVEKYIRGREINIGVLGGRSLGGVEIRPSLEFYSYEAKYTAGLTQYIQPPEIDDRDYDTLKAAAVTAHLALGCGGATRVDFILDDNHTPFILEVNTIPGMTETSLLPKIAAAAGLDFPALVEEILGLTVKGPGAA